MSTSSAPAHDTVQPIIHPPIRWRRALGLVLLLAACGREGVLSPTLTELPRGARVVIGPTAPVLTPGLSQQLLVVVESASGVPIDGLGARWTSSDASVAGVSATGVVLANRVGTATISAAFGSTVAQARLTVQAAPVTSPLLLPHQNVVATIFWVGEGADASNGYISNAESAFDSQWLAHFGGVDAPTPRNGFLPAGFVPLENPFYFALPYSDFDDDGARKQNASIVVPWSASRVYASGESMVKNRWMRITSPQTARSCYAQWEDAGPGLYDDFQYVFGASAPANPFVLDGLTSSSALDVSPAVRSCLGLTADVMRLDWQFVADADVPAGPWTVTVTRRP